MTTAEPVFRLGQMRFKSWHFRRWKNGLDPSWDGYPFYLGNSTTAEENPIHAIFWYNDAQIYMELINFDRASAIKANIFAKIIRDTPEDWFFIFWGKSSGWPSDIDTSSLGLIVYYEEGIDPDVEGQFLPFRDNDGIFWTYFNSDYFPGNSKDCACNAAAMMYYIRNNIDLPDICDYLNKIPLNEMNDCDTHYPEYMLLYYLARAYSEGNDCL